MKSLLALLALGAVTLSAGAPAQQSGMMTPAEHAACAAKGGTVQRAGRMGLEMCVERYKDAGKVCTAKKQCIGQCRYAGDPEKAPRRPKGICEKTSNPFGCYSFIDNKRHVRTICVD